MSAVSPNVVHSPLPPTKKNGKKTFLKEQAMSLRKRFMQHYPFLVPCYARLSCLVVLCTSIFIYIES
jgi:hypothetical protein